MPAVPAPRVPLATFLAKLPTLDDGLARRVERAAARGRVLRYVVAATRSSVRALARRGARRRARRARSGGRATSSRSRPGAIARSRSSSWARAREPRSRRPASSTTSSSSRGREPSALHLARHRAWRLGRSAATGLDWLSMSAKAQAAAVKPFLERLAEGVVVCDGAMGTMLYARGVFLNRCFDELNLSNPTLVRSRPRGVPGGRGRRHRDQHFRGPPLQARSPRPREAGPRRSTARERGSPARRPQGRALVAGSIGPLGKPLEPFGNIAFEDAVAAYREQAEGLAEGRRRPLPDRDDALPRAGEGGARGRAIASPTCPSRSR